MTKGICNKHLSFIFRTFHERHYDAVLIGKDLLFANVSFNEVNDASYECYLGVRLKPFKI